MKSFLIKVGALFLVTLSLMTLLDQIYYHLYSRSWNTDICRPSLMKGQQYDLVFFGSSRTRHHFDTKIFKDKKLKTYNFGITGGATLAESYFLCRDYFQQNKAEYAVIELEIPHNSPPLCFNKFMLFKYKRSYSDYFSYYTATSFTFPFVRFMNPLYDWKKIAFNSIQRASDLKNEGFVPLEGTMISTFSVSKKDIICQDPWIEKLQRLASENNAELIFVIPPIWKGKVDVDHCEQFNLFEHQNYIQDSTLFRDPLHLNKAGAAKYSTLFLHDMGY